MEVVYNYLASQEFRQRIAGVVEAFVTMQSDLETEKRAMHKSWSKREKQLQRALTNTAGMYGELQGIIGASLPEIEGLGLPQLEHVEPNDNEFDVGNRTSDSSPALSTEEPR